MNPIVLGGLEAGESRTFPGARQSRHRPTSMPDKIQMSISDPVMLARGTVSSRIASDVGAEFSEALGGEEVRK
jgi:hypothetical protein